MSSALPLRSKTGCLRCRRRRIKCDESQPVCLRCQKGRLDCIWPGRSHVTPQHLQAITTIGNLYATLFLQTEFVGYKLHGLGETYYPCPATQLSPGFTPLRSASEHQSLMKLSSFLSMMELQKQGGITTETQFEFTVALQEVWVRDAILAFAGLLHGPEHIQSRWTNIQPYYTSAMAAVRRFVTEDLTEGRLEQLLVVSLFLGMIEISNPQNQIFPLLHFEAVGRFLEALNTLQANKTLGIAVSRFHRIALESYIYHTSIQALFWPQTDRYVRLASIHDMDSGLLDTRPEANRIVKIDLKVYIVLFRLAQLTRVKTLSTEQRILATRLEDRVHTLETAMLSPRLNSDSDDDHDNHVATKDCFFASFREMTLLATSALAILSAKVIDRSLLASSRAIRPLVETAFSRLEKCQPQRKYTGDFGWFFTILACAVSTSEECDRLSRNLQRFTAGFWGGDLNRMKKVLELVRSKRVANVKNRLGTEEELLANDTLSLLVEARLKIS